MKIDVHNHAVPEAALDLLRGDDRYGVAIRGDTFVIGERRFEVPIERSNVDPDAKLRELEGRGLEGAAICSSPMLFYYDLDADLAATMARTTNAGLADFAAAKPDRYRWLAHVPMAHPERAAAVLEEAAGAGAVGLEVGTTVAGRRLDDDAFAPVWSAAERLGLPVFVHPSTNERYSGLGDYYLQNVIGNPLETTITIERMICGGVLDRHPALRLVLAHAGGYFAFNAGRLRHARTVRPELAAAPEDPWAARDRIFVDTVCFDVETLRFVVAQVGEANVVMGTDLPFDMSPPAPFAELEQAVGAHAAKRIAEDNPAALYRFA